MTNAYIISVTESEERYFLGTTDIEIRVIIPVSVVLRKQISRLCTLRHMARTETGGGRFL
jgi:hypothetical protein